MSLLGKGRKQRCTPLRQERAAMLEAWLRERAGQPADPVFPSLRGGYLSRDAVERLVTRHVHRGRKPCPSLKRKNVTTHRASAHRRHGASTARRRPIRDRALARTRVGRNHPDVPARRPAIEGTGTVAHAPLGLKPGDTGPTTSCWPSWRASDYADFRTSRAPPTRVCRRGSA